MAANESIMSVLVKICGITTPEDAALAFDAGADWIGLNFVAGPRRIDLSDAARVLTAWANPISAVALVRLSTSNNLTEFIKPYAELGVKRFQLYGDVDEDSTATLHELGLESILVAHIDNESSIHKTCQSLDAFSADPPDYLILDAAADQRLGGTGRQANWKAIDTAKTQGLTVRWPPFLLAGGLNPMNVRQAVQQLRPAGVDVSSGVEAAPGRKDGDKVRAFVRQAKNATEDT